MTYTASNGMNKDIRDALFDEVYRLGKKDPRVMLISDDLDAWGLRRFKRDFPERFINIGVAEQNMIDVAAGLASCGKKVFVYGICSFVTARCLEQIKFSVCSMNLPVVIIGAGAGFSFSFDGPSHHGIHDVGIMRMLPETAIYNPIDASSAAMSARTACRSKTPAYIRLDKGTFPELYRADDDFSQGFKILAPIRDVTVVSTGFMTHQVMQAREKIKDAVGAVDIFRIKPISSAFVAKVLKRSRKIITVEENMMTGGIGSAVSELLADNNLTIPLKRLAVRDHQFDQFGSREWLQSLNGLDLNSIAKAIKKYA